MFNYSDYWSFDFHNDETILGRQNDLDKNSDITTNDKLDVNIINNFNAGFDDCAGYTLKKPIVVETNYLDIYLNSLYLEKYPCIWFSKGSMPFGNGLIRVFAIQSLSKKTTKILFIYVSNNVGNYEKNIIPKDFEFNESKDINDYRNNYISFQENNYMNYISKNVDKKDYIDNAIAGTIYYKYKNFDKFETTDYLKLIGSLLNNEKKVLLIEKSLFDGTEESGKDFNDYQDFRQLVKKCTNEFNEAIKKNIEESDYRLYVNKVKNLLIKYGIKDIDNAINAYSSDIRDAFNNKWKPEEIALPISMNY